MKRCEIDKERLVYYDEMHYFCLKNCFNNCLILNGIEDSLLRIRTGLEFKIRINYDKTKKIILNENIRNCIVRPQAILKCNDKSYLVEVVRKVDGWEEEFLNKLNRYENVIENYKNLNIKFTEKPNLIVQGESYDHMLEIMNMIKNRQEEVNIDIIYTYDRILLYNLEDAFFSLEEKQSKKNLFSFLFKC